MSSPFLPSRRNALRLALPLVALAGLTAVTAPASPALAGKPLTANCDTTVGDPSISSFLTHEEVERRLAQLEQSSKGRVEVDVAGATNEGREIYTARVGEGDTVVFVQSQIHGNEPHGTVALLDLLKFLGGSSAQAAEIREAVTVVAIPQLNGDGAANDTRQNDRTWADVVADFPQLAGVSPAWNYSSRVGGFDVNRDFNPNLDYVPKASDFPGTSAGTGWYITTEAQATRDVYRSLEQEFGIVDYFVDLHNQGPCYTGENPDGSGTGEYSTLSISGRFIADPTQFGNWPNFDYDASRQANVAVFDALQKGQSGFGAVTLYPQDTNLPGTALGSFALRGSATVLFETIGQTQTMGQEQAGMLTKQVLVGLRGLVDAIADGSIDGIDPARYESIPERTSVPRS